MEGAPGATLTEEPPGAMLAVLTATELAPSNKTEGKSVADAIGILGGEVGPIAIGEELPSTSETIEWEVELTAGEEPLVTVPIIGDLKIC